jgi:hypothetical protein
MSFTPRERAIEYLRELKDYFSEWMDAYEIFEDYKDEYKVLIQNLKGNQAKELSKKEFSDMNDLTSELSKWAEELEGLVPAQSASRNKMLEFIGGVNEGRWEIYYPAKIKDKSGHPLNQRPIGSEKIRFDIHKKDDLNYITINHTDIGTLNWKLFRLELDNQPGVYVGSIPAWELELVCNVPALESDISREEASRRILDHRRSRDRWQRQINKKTRESIAMFFKNQDSFFANPVIIHDPESEFMSYDIDENNGIVNTSIDLSFISGNQSIKLEGGQMIDSRPLTIIDGQHRIRGASLAPTNYDQRLLVILLPKQISASTAGKLFAEINTLSTALKDKHRMFLSHRFAVSSPNPKFSFSKYNPEDGKTTRSRANRMSYEFAARLSIDDNCSFLKDNIRFLDQNSPQTLFDIEKWVEYTYTWFQNYPYVSQQAHSDEHVLEELSNYFEAWHETIGENNWRGDLGCLFRTKLQFRVILKRFKQIYEIAKSHVNAREEIISKDNFKQVLSPLENIPFTNNDIYSRYNSSGEYVWKLLDAWVQDAIKYQSASSEEEILDEEKIGIPGAGIISPPLSSENHQVDIPPGGIFPTDGTKYVTAHRPINCGYTCNIRIGQGDKIFKNASYVSKQIIDSAQIPIRSTPQIEEISDGLYLELEWETIERKVINRIQIN